ncbi:hypothetical protein SETIT_J029500v2 [Setaria italica]|uniref:Uncharacterized protein n=1 Tax=Setaria italica TaxID=4555 RepID=A0A368PH53_SETIT|nr:hypothetical protein SETIT_J029500v2 [Setaria italica]
MGSEPIPWGIGPDRLLFPRLMCLREGVLLNRYSGMLPLNSFESRENHRRFLMLCSNRGGIWPERMLSVRRRNSSLVRFPMVLGMVSERPFPRRSRNLSRRSLPISAGMCPATPILVRLSMVRKERLSRCWLSAPWRGTSTNHRAVTRCRWWLHETPTHRQKDTLDVQLPVRIPRGSESSDLKAK